MKGSPRTPSTARAKSTAAAVWAVSSPTTQVIAARSSGALDLFSLPTARRSPQKPPPSPPPPGTGRPTAVAPRPPAAPASFPLSVVGTSAGHVVLDGDVLVHLGAAPVSAVLYRPKVIVAVGGPAKDVVVINPKQRAVVARFPQADAHVSPLTAIAACDDHKALVCSQSLTLVDLSNGGVLHRYHGHSTPVSAAIAVSAITPPCFLTACSDQFVSAWPIDPAKLVDDGRTKRRKTSKAVSAYATLAALEQGVISLAADAPDPDANCVTVSALFRNGVTAVWRSWCPRADAGPVPATFVVRPAPLGADVFLAAFSKKGALTVLYGSGLKPDAHSIVVKDVEGDEVMLPEFDSNVLMSGADVRSIRADHPKVDLVEADADTRASNVSAVPAPGPAKRKPNGTVAKKYAIDDDGNDDDDDDDDGEDDDGDDDDDDDDQKARGTKAGKDSASKEVEEENANTDDDDDDGEPSIQQKLAALGVSVKKPSRNSRAPHNASLLSEKLNSRVQILEQSITSGDPKMLRRSVRDAWNRSVVSNTVTHMNATLATGPLLDMLVKLLQENRTDTEIYVCWIREILLQHASTLITKQSRRSITALLAVIEGRTQALDALTRLQGRLELIMCQAQRIQRTTGLSGGMPMAEYREEDASESEGEEDEDEDESGEEDDDEEGEEEEDATMLKRLKEAEEIEEDDEGEASDAAMEGVEWKTGAAVATHKMNGKIGPAHGEESEESSDIGD